MISEQNQRSEELSPSSTTLGASERANIVEFLDRILDKGIVINGDITILVAGTEILSLRINLVIASIETAKRYGIELPWEKWQSKQELEKYNDKNQVKTLNENGKKLGRQARSKGEKNWEDAKNWVDKQYQKKKKIGKMQRIG